MIHLQTVKSLTASLVAVLLSVLGEAPAAEEPPALALTALESELATSHDLPSEVRKRLAIRRVVRDAQKLFDDHPQAPDRYAALGLVFRAQKQLVAMEKSAANRKALLDTCRQITQAPDAQAELRFDAELLLSQTEIARQGADDSSRLDALKQLVTRYRDTTAETKALRVAILMAFEMGDNRLVQEFRDIAQERFPVDLEMLAFLREQLSGQTFGAPISGAYTRWDGKPVRFPMDLLGRTSTLYFWSKEGDGMERLEAIAAEWKQHRQESIGRLDVISFNLDELPDGGHSIITSLGLDDWQVIKLPGGKEHPAYKAYARMEPWMVTVSPTGFAALHAAGSRRVSMDYARWMPSSLARAWTDPSYGNQLTSLFTGEFLILDPSEEFDPTKPPELKGQAGAGKLSSLSRNADSVPEDELRAIQNAFLMAPARYDVGLNDLSKRYLEVVTRCHEVIAKHPQAPDLWLVRNRLIVALLGLWKTDNEIDYHEQAVAVAQTLIDSPHPPGMDLVARFCLAKAAMRDPQADLKQVIAAFLAQQGGERASGPAVAAAAILALDAGEGRLHDQLRGRVLARHSKNAQMWTVVSFLLDRYHHYHLFEAPYSGGRIPGYKERYFLSNGKQEQADRKLAAGFKTLDGEPLSLPTKGSGKWTAIIFARPWNDQDNPQCTRLAAEIQKYNETRGEDDIQTMIAVIADPSEAITNKVRGKEITAPVVRVDGGMKSPLIHQLGMLKLESQPNAVLLDPDGRIAVSLSGWVHKSARTTGVISNIIECHDEKTVSDALAGGHLDKARQLAFKFAPPDGLEPDEAKKKNNDPRFRLPHLRSRAGVFMAMGDWQAALKDAEEVLRWETIQAASLSLVTDDMKQAEAFRDSILELSKPAED